MCILSAKYLHNAFFLRTFGGRLAIFLYFIKSIMCRISRETAIRASESLRMRSRAGAFASAAAPVDGVINVSAKICGRTYSRGLTVHEIRSAYGASLKSVKGALSEGLSMPGASVTIAK